MESRAGSSISDPSISNEKSSELDLDESIVGQRNEKLVTNLQKIALMLARLLTVVITIMVYVWASGKNTNNRYLGGFNFGKKLFNYHPVFMVTGLILFSGWSITAYRLPFCSFSMNRTLHVTLHFMAKVCMTLGLLAVSTSKDYPNFNSSSTGYEPHLYTAHSWLGVTTSIFLFQNDILGFLIYILPFASRKIMSLYRPEHIFFGKFAFIAVCMTVVTGIMKLNDLIGCSYTIDHMQENSAVDYHKIPVGCRISNGIAVLVVIMLMFILFGLEPRVVNIKHSHWLRQSFAMKRMRSREQWSWLRRTMGSSRPSGTVGDRSRPTSGVVAAESKDGACSNDCGDIENDRGSELVQVVTSPLAEGKTE